MVCSSKTTPLNTRPTDILFRAILRNPEDYPNPERFSPERFLKNGQIDPDVRSPLTVAFGYGRRYAKFVCLMYFVFTLFLHFHRTCPGRWFSSASLFITIASTLHTMHIHPVLGPDGKLFDPEKYVFPGIKL